MSNRPLSRFQHQAASLLGSGHTRKEVAEEIGVHELTISRWGKREDFQEVVERARAKVLEENPTAHATLEQALTAVKANGDPDWQIRVAASRALLGHQPNGGTPAEQVRETTIHMDRLKP